MVPVFLIPACDHFSPQWFISFSLLRLFTKHRAHPSQATTQSLTTSRSAFFNLHVVIIQSNSCETWSIIVNKELDTNE
ncbi:hypothetical protein E2C01_023828 [Portunus trituberculatus]|uniref:Uncharacterized protein n=1 Tax=Portunus trituberculatus TaxID=210409 RepID=A0A5B7E903_PORTR|nr:hypothetical protein [Portunus trituberculatus]